MASLSKKYNFQKLNGVVYTPDFVVYKILSDIGYSGIDILGKTILDPACGDGRFLVIAAQKIIALSSKEDLQKNLECIYGWDIDKQAIKECKENLNELIKNQKIKVNWHIEVCNSIERYQKPDIFSQSHNQTFDFIVGNPPYIRIQHLDELQRKYIQNNYSFCTNGSTDIYIAFMELCYHLLADNGICGLITPNTFFYTETAKFLRDFFAKTKSIKQITNYVDIQLFDNANTYSAITVFDKYARDTFLYQHATDQTKFKERTICQNELMQQQFWQLSPEIAKKRKGKQVKEICKIHVGITTLCDKAYIFPIEDTKNQVVVAKTKLRGEVEIEKNILKPIIKGSTLKHSNEPIKEYVLFPYKKLNGKHQILPEEELKRIYPLAYNYLLSIKEELDKRDNGKPNSVAWYAFGRSQGLDTSFGKKIVFSPMNCYPNFILIENEEATLYSGYCIKYNGDDSKLLQQLNSDAMQRFIEGSSRDFRGGWKAYNKKVVGEFIVE